MYIFELFITLMVMLIRGHGHRVLVLWFIIIQDFRLRAVLSALFLLLAVLKPVQLNCFASEGACVVTLMVILSVK